MSIPSKKPSDRENAGNTDETALGDARRERTKALERVHHTYSISEAFDLALTLEEQVSSELKVPRLLTAKELAATLNVPLWRIYELVDDGKGPPSMRIGKTLRFPENGVVQWIHDQTSGGNHG